MKVGDDKKIEVTLRIEPGCLGPEGDSHISKFCNCAQSWLDTHDYSDCVKWRVVGRFDKLLPELEYGLMTRRLTRDQAQRYLTLFDLEIDQFEDSVFDRVPELVDRYFGRA